MIDLPVKSNKPRISKSVMLCSFNWYREKDPRTPLGMALIAAYCENHLEINNGISIIDTDVRDNVSMTLHQVLDDSPDILGIGVYVWNIDIVKQFLFGLRSMNFEGKIILGGPEITYGNKSLLEEFPEGDYFVRGDGEIAFTQILMYEEGISYQLPKGVFTRINSDFNSYCAVSSHDIVSPFLSEKILDGIIGNSNKNFVRWQTQRGCVYRCSFCAFPNGYDNFVVTDLRRIEQELQLFKQKCVKSVAVLDPIFFKDKERGMKILDLIENICPNIHFAIQSRVEHLDTQIIQKIKNLNISLEFGIQTLDKKVGREIKRVNNQSKIDLILSELRVKNIQFECHLIYGLPYQPLHSLKQDYEYLAKYCSDIKLFPLIRLRGTGLDIKLYQPKYSEKLVFSPLFPNEIIETQWMTRREILEIKQEVTKWQRK